MQVRYLYEAEGNKKAKDAKAVSGSLLIDSACDRLRSHSQTELALNLLLARLVEHCTGIAEVMGSNPIGASEFLLGFICNRLSYFINTRVTFTCILYPQCTHNLYHIHFTSPSSYNRYKLNLHLTCFQWGFIAAGYHFHLHRKCVSFEIRPCWLFARLKN